MNVSAPVNASGVCSACCIAFSYQADFGSVHVPLVNFVLSSIWLIASLVLLARITVLNRKGLSLGYSLVASPVEAIRVVRRGSTGRVFIPTFYFSYTVVNCFFMLIEIFVALPDDSPLLSWIWRFLCGAREAFDMALVVFLCLPRVTRFTRWLPLLGGAAIMAVFSVFVIFNSDPSHACPWCTQHWPTSRVAWLFLAEGIACVVLALWAWKRPFRSYNPRPVCALVCAFWTPIYLSMAILLPLMDHLYPANNVDWGYCLLMTMLGVYYVFYPFVLYVGILRDSRFIFLTKADDDIQSGDQGEDRSLLTTESLIRHNPLSPIGELLADESLLLIESKSLQIQRRIGYGGFGEVFLAQWNGTQVAVKMLLRMEPDHIEAFAKEMALLAKMRHPNVLLMVGMVLESGHQALITEYCSAGSLFDAIHREHIDWPLKSRMAVQTAQAMEYLHQRNVIHRDLKPGNVLLAGANMDVRLSDFGLSRDLRSRTAMTATGYGTIVYAAPEVLLQDEQGKPCDVWSFGVILWEMSAEEVPFDGLQIGMVILGIVNDSLRLDREKCKPETPAPIVHCMNRCLQRKPEDRVDFKTIIELLY